MKAKRIDPDAIDIDFLKQEFNRFRAELTGVKEKLGDNASEALDQISAYLNGSAMSSRIAALESELEYLTGKVKNTSKDAVGKLEKEVSARPLASIAIAFGVGVLAAQLFPPLVIFAMSLPRRAGYLVKSAALWAAVAIAALCIALAGLGFLIAGFFIFIARHTDAASAAAITGGVMLLLAIGTGVIGGEYLRRQRDKQPSLLAEFGGLAGLIGQLIGGLVRRDPKKAVIISMILGALAEYVTSDRKK